MDIVEVRPEPSFVATLYFVQNVIDCKNPNALLSCTDSISDQFSRNKNTPSKFSDIRLKTNDPLFSRPSRAVEIDSLLKQPKPILQNDQLPDQEDLPTRRVSIPSNRTTPKKKPDCGTHVVAKSELWDTGNQHRCLKSHQKNSRVSISQEEGMTSIN